MSESTKILGNRYKLERVLAHGGFGTVYMARDERLALTVVVKQVTNVHSPQHLEREVRLLAQLRHPALPQIIDYFAADRSYYLVMPYISGIDLGRYLEERPQRYLDEAEALDIIARVLDAVEYLHDLSVIHRDIKPSNILIAPDRRVFLIDFGLIQAADAETPVAAVTGGYSAPEQYMGKPDVRSDLYSLGATLYRMLGGINPPNALQRRQGDDIVPLRSLNPTVSAKVERIVMNLLALRPEDRYQSAAQLRRDLVAARETTRSSSPTMRGIPRHSGGIWPTEIIGWPTVSSIRVAVGFFGLALALFLVGIQALMLLLPARISYQVLPGAEIIPTGSGLIFWPLLVAVLLVSIAAGIAAARSRRLLQALGIIVVSVVLTLIAIILAWSTPAVQAAEPLPAGPTATPPSTGTALSIAPYRTDLAAAGPDRIKMWSSLPMTLTVSVITNTAVTDWPLPHSGPYTVTVAVQANNFGLAKDIEKVQVPQRVALGVPARWIWVVAPTDPNYDAQAVVFNVAMQDQQGQVSTPFAILYIEVTFFGFPGWVRLVGLAIAGLAGLIGLKEIVLRYLPQPEPAPKAAPPVSAPSVSAHSVQPEATPTVAAAAPPKASPAARKPARSQQKGSREG